jgi:hypothetical protein
MPIDKSQLQRIIECMDSLISRLDKLEKRRAVNDADEVQDPNEEIDDPLDAPPQPFSDGVRDERSPPQRIHGVPEF